MSGDFARTMDMSLLLFLAILPGELTEYIPRARARVCECECECVCVCVCVYDSGVGIVTRPKVRVCAALPIHKSCISCSPGDGVCKSLVRALGLSPL